MSKKIIICITALLFSGFIYAKGAFVEVGDPSFFPDDFTYLVSMKIDNDGNIYAAYIQDDYYFSVAKFDGEKWSDVSEQKFSGGIGNVPETPDVWPYVSFALSSDGVPFVAFPEAQNYSLNVMKFDSESGKWEYVGKSNITDYKTNYTSIAVDSEGVPYVVFSGCKSDDCKRISVDQEEYTIDTSNVMKFNGTEWEYVGEPMSGLETEGTLNNKILLNSNDIPIISFNYKNYFVSVMKYNGSEWGMVGDLDEAGGGNLFIDKEDNLYLETYKDGIERLIICDNNEWFDFVDLPEKGRKSFAVDEENRIYAATDQQSTGLSVNRLNEEGIWEVVGDQEYIHESVHTALIETDKNNIPYVAFAEKKGVVLMKYDPEAGETTDDSDGDISDEDSAVDEDETADENKNDDNDTAVDENSISDEETASDEDSVPVNDKDSGSSGCTVVVM